MKKYLALLACGAALPVTSVPAIADGLPSLKDTVVQPAPTTWTGVYFGVGAGYGHNHSKNNYHDNSGDPSSSVNETADGGFVSTMFGFDRQIGSRFLVGAFADFSTSALTRGDEDIHNGLVVDRSWAIGGRLGYLVNDRTLIYANAGFTQAHFSNDGWWDIDPTGGGSTLHGKGSRWFSGYFVGGGIERKLNDNFYLRGEARYSDFGGEVTNTGNVGNVHYVDREVPSIVTGELALVYKLDRDRAFNPDPVNDDHGPRVITYNGIDAASNSVYWYGGTVFGLTNDLYSSGFVLRTEGVIASYNYDQSVAPHTNIDADDRSFDIMLGYQWVNNYWSAIGYLGYEARSVHLSPFDPHNDVTGGANGFKVAAEFETDDELPYYASLEGSYSTAFDSYYGQARIGWNRKTITFGPEAAVYGDGADYAPRVGAFATIPFKMWWLDVPAKLTFDLGHQFEGGSGDGSTRAGGEGVYGGSMLRIDF